MSTYLVTGATSGIGLATARQLASQGDDLVLMARGEESLKLLGEELGQHHVLVAGDVRDSSAVRRAFEAKARIDGVVHAAAVASYGHFQTIPEEVVANTITINLLGAVTVARAALSHFHRHGGGRLVLIGSLLGDVTVPYMSPYVVSKWGVHGLARTLQQEARGTDIQVSLVSPGGVDTPIYDNAATYLGVRGQAPGIVQDANDVAARVLTALHRPRRQIQSGPLNRIARLGFRLTPAIFDLAIGPFMRWQGLRKYPETPTSGNVLHPLTHTVPKGPAMPKALVISRDVDAPAHAVWGVLSDGWTYATWVVGASRVRDVDADWPTTGTRIHHSFGPWPAVIQDYTRVERSIAERELVLTARGWPVGEARVVITIEPTGPENCRVSIREDATAGPGKGLPKPLRQAVIGPRNKETLYRLALIAEGRYRNAMTQRV